MVTNKTDIVRFQRFAHHRFDNRPGTGRFLRIYSCVVTYCTGAGWRLYMKTSADARPGTVRCRTLPGRRCTRSAGHRTVPDRCHLNLNDPTKRRTGAVEF